MQRTTKHKPETAREHLSLIWSIILEEIAEFRRILKNNVDNG